MAHRIYQLTGKAIADQMTWDEAIYNGEIETVAEFETMEDALDAWCVGDFDPDLTGVE